MAKLQKHKAYTYTSESGEEIEHFKHTVVIPEDAIQQLRWKEGVELAVTTKGNSMILKPDEDENNK